MTGTEQNAPTPPPAKGPTDAPATGGGDKPKGAAAVGLSEGMGLLWRLFNEAGLRYWRGYAVALVLMGVVAVTTALSAWIMRDVINEIFVDRREDMILPIAGAVALIFIVKGAATYFQTVILSRIGNAIVADVQRRLFDHVLSQRIDFFDRFPVSDVATRLSHNARAAREALNLVITRLGRDLLSVIALGVVMVLQNPGLSLFVLVGAPPVIIGLNLLVTRIKKIAKAEFQGLTQIIGTVQETGYGLRVVKAFGLEGAMRGRMDDAVSGVKRRANAIAMISAAPIPLMETVAGLAIAAVILYAGSQVAGGSTDPGAFFAFLTALLMAYDPARRVAQMHVVLQAHLVGVGIMYAMLDENPKLIEAPDATPLSEGPGRIALEDVHFRYAGEQGAGPDGGPALEGLTLTAEAGKVTALVGPSGAGKSTVFALIERFYDPDRGRVTVDGADLRGVTLASLRARIAYVSQDAFLFEGTVRDNLLIGRGEASEAEVVAAAQAANADGFIRALPRGYDTELGANGARLSGGQRQRLAIARAMLRRPQILLLDEPTSALDAEAEAHVTQALERLMQGRTTLVIAHRFSTVRHAAAIHVIDRGRLVETGTHEALMAGDGLYARLHALQFAAPPAPPEAPPEASPEAPPNAAE